MSTELCSIIMMKDEWDILEEWLAHITKFIPIPESSILLTMRWLEDSNDYWFYGLKDDSDNELIFLANSTIGFDSSSDTEDSAKASWGLVFA